MRRIIATTVVLLLIVGTLSATAGIMLSQAAFKLIKPDAHYTLSQGITVKGHDAKVEDAQN